MLNRVGKDASGRATNSRRRAAVGRWMKVESLEGRQLLTASIDSINNVTSPTVANVVSPEYQGYQVPIVGGTTHAQTYTVTSDNPGIKASITQGRFLTVGVSHTAANSSDVTFSGTMTFQIFDDFTPVTTSMITALVNGITTNTTANVTQGQNFYLNKTFFRIAPGFPTTSTYIAQGGSADNTGSVAANAFKTPYGDEFVQSAAFTGAGQLAMANSGADTNDSQFFITTGAPNTALSYHHTIWGQLVTGNDILADLTKVATTTPSGSTDQTSPINPVTINQFSLSNTSPNAVVHVDTTVSPAGAVGNVTVTATDVTDGTTASQTFTVTTGSPTSTPLRPYIGSYDSSLTISNTQNTRFQINPVSPTPGDSLVYTVQRGVNGTGSSATFASIDTTKIASATVDANGVVTIVPVAGATGATTLLIGVSDSNLVGSTGSNSPANYEYHVITVNLAAGTRNQRPLAARDLIDSIPGGTTPIQLTGTNVNATTTLPVTYALATQPTHGTITNFDATTGALDYTPTAGYAGPDAFTYTVTDPNSGLSSFATPIKINVANADTGAVRFIANDGSVGDTTPGTLVVTPNPRTDGGTNTIAASVVNGQVQVSVNGVVDAIEPTTASVDRIVIYGSKANDNITIDPTLTTIATIDGGHGGKNVLKAGAGETREHGWFGPNTLVQGSSSNFQLGRRGHDKFVKGTGTSDVIFQGEPGFFRYHLNRHRQLPTPTTGTYYKFAQNGKTIVPTTNPYATLNKAERAARTAELKARRAAGTSTTNTTTTNTGTGNSSNQGGTISNGTATGTGSTVVTA